MQVVRVFVVFIFSIGIGFGQAVGDFRSNGTGGGNWNSLSSWEEFDGTWSAASKIPDNTDGVITILGGDIITVPGGFSVTVDELIIQNTGTLDIALADFIITFSNGLVTVLGNGYIDNAGTISGDSQSTLIFSSGSPGGEYRHNQNGSNLPIAIWNSGSICRITGVTNAAPGNLNQNFSDFTWNCPSQTNAIFLGGQLTSINNNLNIINSNSQFVGLSNGTSSTTSIGGNLLVDDSSKFYISTITNYTLNVTGNVSVTSNQNTFAILFTANGNVNFNVGGDFIVDNANAVINFAAGTGTGNLNLSGDLIISNGTLTETSSGIGNINFSTGGPYNFSNTGSIINSVNFNIQSGAIVDLNSFSVTGGGSFTLESNASILLGSNSSGGAIQTGSTAGNIRVTGSRIFAPTSTIVYNGTSAQFIGNGQPNNNIRINNPSGVSLASDAVVQNITFTAGNLDLNSNNLTIEGNITQTSGELITSASSNLTINGSGNAGTLPLSSNSIIGNFTLNRGTSGSLALGNDLTITDTLSVQNGTLNFSNQRLTLQNGTSFGASTGTLSSNSSSRLVIGGSASTEDLRFNAGVSIGDIEINKTGTVTFITNSFNLDDSLLLTNGTLDLEVVLLLNDGATIRREAGDVTLNGGNFAVLSGNTYNLVYTNDLTTGFEFSQDSVELNDLTILSGNVTLGSANSYVNGNLSLNNGSLILGSNNLFLRGSGVYTRDQGILNSSSGGEVVVDGTYTIEGTGQPSFPDLRINGSLTAKNGQMNVAGNFTNNGIFNGNGGTINFNGTTTIGGTATTTFAGVRVAGGLTLPASMNVTGNWTYVSGSVTQGTGSVNFTGSNQTIDSDGMTFNNVSIAGTGVKSLAGSLDVNGNLTISSSLDVTASNHQINFAGNWSNSGTFNAREGTVILDATGQTQSLSGTTTFYNLTSNNTFNGTPRPGVTGTVNIENVFTLNSSPNAFFDADGPSNTGIFRLLSTADDGTGDARIAILANPANFTGNVNVQRFMSAEGRFYRYIGASVAGATVSDLQGEIRVIGPFTGASSGGAGGHNIFTYTASTQQWTGFPVAANTESFTPGVGYAVFVDEGNSNVTLDLRGAMNKGSFNWTGLAYNNDGDVENDWNLVSNPYPSAIDFDQLTRSDVARAFYVPDRAAGNFRTWVDGVATNDEGNGSTIAMGQAFWIRTDGTSPSLSADENDKVSSGPIFYRTTDPGQYIMVTLSNGTKSDQTAIRFKPVATNGVDSDYDALKRDNDIFNLFTSWNGHNYAINTLPDFGCETSIPLSISNASPGIYTLDLSNVSSISNGDVYVYDRYSDSGFHLPSDSSFVFEITNDAVTYNNRFALVFEESPLLNTATVSNEIICLNEDASILLENTLEGVEYWISNGDFTSDTLQNSGSFTIPFDAINENDSFHLYGKRIQGCRVAAFDAEAVITIIEKPQIEGLSDQAICGSGEVQIDFASTATSFMIYDSAMTLLQTSDIPSFNVVAEESSSYFIQGFNENGCPTDTFSVDVNVLPLPVIEDLDTVFSCEGEPLTYVLEDSSIRYRWYDSNDNLVSSGNALALDRISESQVFFVEAEDSSGCTSAMKKPLTIIMKEAPGVFADNQDICFPGDSMQLSASSDMKNVTFFWYIEDSTDSAFYSGDELAFASLSDTTFYLDALSGDGCKSLERVALDINIINPPKPAIGVSNNILISSYETGNQWLRDSIIIDGANERELEAIQSGFYQVEVTTEDGCVIKSDGYVYRITSLDESGITYPNPVRNILYINPVKQFNSFKITDVNGQVVRTGSFTDETTQLDLTTIPAGSYVLHLENGSAVEIIRISKVD